MYTTVQQVRQRTGYQHYRIDAPLYETGNSSIWNVNIKDLERFVPRNNDGATLATTADVQVKYNGSSVGISAIDIDSGDITMSTGYASGSSIVATYASSVIQSSRVYQYIEEAHSTLLSRLAVLYELPLSVSVPFLNTLESKLAAAHLLIDSYGIAGQDSSEDGYKLLEEVHKELDKIASGSIQLVDNTGNEVPQATESVAGGGNALGGQGVRVPGYLFTVDQEKFEVVKREDYVNEN